MLHDVAYEAAKLAAPATVRGADAADLDGARVRRGKRADETGEGGLAGARLAGEGHELARTNLERDAVERGGRAVAEPHIAHAEGGCDGLARGLRVRGRRGGGADGVRLGSGPGLFLGGEFGR